MALNLPVTFPNGITADYWKVVGVSVDVPTSTVNLSVALYLDSEARTDGREPIEVSQVGGISALPTLQALIFKSGGNLVAAVYDYLKSLPEFEGAKDV